MLAVGTDAREDRQKLLRRCAVDAFLQKLGIAKHGRQRRSQLVAHVGDELRLMLAGDLEFAALLGDLFEQAGMSGPSLPNRGTMRPARRPALIAASRK